MIKPLHFLMVLLVVSYGLLNGLDSFPRGGDFKDFGSFIAAGRAAANGENPYAVLPLTFSGAPHRFHPAVDAINLNPPSSLLVFRLLANRDPLLAFRVWYLGSFVIYLLVLALLIKAYLHRMTILRVAWTFSLAGLWTTLELGQIYMLLLLASVGAWLFLKQGRYRVAGLLIGILIAVKPNFLLWPLLLLLAGYVSVFVVASVTAVLISLAPLLVFGYTVYIDWLKATGAFSGIALPGNGSLPGLLARLGLPWLSVPLGVVLVCVVLIWAWRCRPSPVKLSGLALVLVFLISPVTWPGYTLFLLPVFLERTWSYMLRIAAVMLAIPHVLVWFGSQVSIELYVIVGSLYCWALILVLIALAKEQHSLLRKPASPG